MKNYLLIIFCLLNIIVGCKKSTVNNPNIDDVVLNLFAESTDPTSFSAMDININNEAGDDFQFFIFHPNENRNNHTIELRISNADYEFLIQRPDDTYTIKKIENGIEIKPSNETWHVNDGRFLLMYYEKDGVKYGSSDIGNQYIAFRKRNSSGGYYYGWILINIERGEKITIKEYALHKVADTSIKAGEK